MLHKERLVPFIFSSLSEDFAPDSAEKYYFLSTNNFYFTPVKQRAQKQIYVDLFILFF